MTRYPKTASQLRAKQKRLGKARASHRSQIGPFSSDSALAQHAGHIFKRAYEEAYEAGFEIVVRRGDHLVLVQKGRDEQIIRTLEPRVTLPVGTVLQLI